MIWPELLGAWSQNLASLAKKFLFQEIDTIDSAFFYYSLCKEVSVSYAGIFQVGRVWDKNIKPKDNIPWFASLPS